jgi:large conductance mechanosensitive channel
VARLRDQAARRAPEHAGEDGDADRERRPAEPAGRGAHPRAPTLRGGTFVLEATVAHRERPATGLAAGSDERHSGSLRLPMDIRSRPTDRGRKAMTSLLKEFRDFLMRGNLIELAVAFVMGIAFAALINSFVTNLVMPVIAAIIGKPSFDELTFTIHKSVFHYGAFITDVIQFLAIAAAVFFFIVKPVQVTLARRRGRDAEVEAPSDEERRHQELVAAVRGIRA